MSINIEQLDKEYIDQDISILLGKNFILKFNPQKTVFDSNEGLQKLINSPDLLPSDLNKKVRALMGMSKSIFDKLSESIRTMEMLKKLGVDYPGKLSSNDGASDSMKKFFYGEFKKQKEEIIKKGNGIGALEKELELYLAQDNNLYFCKECNAYLGDSFETLPDSCSVCGEKTDWGQTNNIVSVRFLDNKVLAYLSGLWFEDYIAKIFNKLGWKTWCHGLVVGASGIAHQVDILAINSSDGRVLICECKTTKITKEHIFDLSAQFYDIKSSLAFLFSMDTVNNERLTEYMRRTAGLCLVDELKNDPDSLITGKIAKFLSI